MANIKDVAEMAGVSVATVSRVLSASPDRSIVRSQTADRVRMAAAQMNYRGNYHVAAMRRGRADVMGFALHYSSNIRSDDSGRWYFNELRDGIESALDKFGISVMGIRPTRNETALQRGEKLVNKRQLDALIVPGHMAHFRKTTELLSVSPNLPIVVVDNIQDVGHPCVRFDAESGIQAALQHLRDLGHRKLLWAGPTDPSATTRETAFLRSAWEMGLSGVTCRSELPAGKPIGLTALYDMVETRMSEFLRSGDRDWTAIVGYSDVFAIGASRALHKAGLRIPEDISVIGFDDSFAANCWPPLTTVSHCLFEMGQAAGELALRLFEADPATRATMQSETQILKGELIVRSSTGLMRKPPNIA